MTEKTIKALCLGHPALVVGNPSSLQFVRQLGFETFSPFLDESYDAAEMAQERFARLAAELVRLTEGRRDAPIRLEPELQEICRWNARHARGGLLRAYRSSVEASSSPTSKRASASSLTRRRPRWARRLHSRSK